VVNRARFWKDDEELIALSRRELFPAVVGDVMDRLGLRRQFLPPQIQPLAPEMVVIGRAMTVLTADYFVEDIKESRNPVLSQPWGLMLDALDDLKRNEVYLCTGGTPRYSTWGELMSTRAQVLGAAGAVLDGYTRDTPGILELKFPTFCYGRYAQDQSNRGKVVDFRIPVEVGGVRIAPGDLLFGDIDGVCAIPREAEDEVFQAALEKARTEKSVRTAIAEGMSAKAAFEKYGVL
jgi:regulator of RNase E activity RraA